MREFLIQCAKNLAENNNILETYEDLAQFYKKENFIKGYASTVEKIWHIKKDSELLLELYKYANEKIRDAHLACLFQGMYFYNYSPDFFKNFLETIKLDKKFINEIILESKTNDFILLIHRHFVCSFLITYILNLNDLELVLILSNYLKQLITQIEIIKKEQHNYVSEDLLTYERDKKYLSSNLSKIENHNDINRLAIDLNINNEKAYLNIIEDLLTYENYDEALSFYNNNYAPIFNKHYLQNIKDLCWDMSLRNSQIYNFYKSLLFQKIAIDFELKEQCYGE